MDSNALAAAKRAMEDKAFAQAVLDGKEDYPEVREAILADIAHNSEVSGFLNPQPLPPGIYSPDQIEVLSWSWGAANLPNLSGLVDAAGSGQASGRR